MTDSPRELHLPAQYAVHGRILRNAIQQLRRPLRPEPVILSAAKLRRSDAHALRRADGSSLLVIDKRVSAPDDVEELLYAQDLAPLVNGQAGPLGGVWLKPIAASPDDLALDPAEAACRKIVASWQGRFAFREERRDGDRVIEQGLRPPQIGALYGVHDLGAAAPPAGHRTDEPPARADRNEIRHARPSQVPWSFTRGSAASDRRLSRAQASDG